MRILPNISDILIGRVGQENKRENFMDGSQENKYLWSFCTLRFFFFNLVTLQLKATFITSDNKFISSI